MLMPVVDDVEESKKKKKKRKKVSTLAPEGGTAATATEADVPTTVEEGTSIATPVAIDLDAPEPREEPVRGSVPLPGSPLRATEDTTPVARDGAVVELPVLGSPEPIEGQDADQGLASTSSQGPAPMATGEPSSMGGGTGEATPAPGRPLVEIPFCHSFAEIGRQRWEKRRAQLIGQLDEWFARADDPPEVDKFVPNLSLRNDDSVLLSGRAQLAAFDQFLLPRDIEMLAEIPTGGLRMSLLSYCIRGALVGEELHDRVGQAIQACTQQALELSEEKKARESAMKRVGLLEAEKADADAQRAREMERKQSVISNLEALRSKQAATMIKLKEEMAELRSTAERSQAAVAQQGERIKLLEENVKIETMARQAASSEALLAQRALEDAKVELGKVKASAEGEILARQAAQAELLSAQDALEGARVELEDTKAARDLALADVKSIEARLGYMTSEDGKKEVINEYRRGPVGKAEVSLAVKAGFDFLKARLPPQTLESLTVPYPSRVRSCVGLLEDLEARGGGVPLSSDEEEDDDEEGSDEGDGDDEEDDSK